MAKKQITQKEAKEKYGIVISKSQKLDKTKFFLLANGDVVDSLGDIRYKKPKCYGDYQSKSWKWLDNRENKIIDFFRERLERNELDMLYELLEVERELTLREEQPY
jgi:hypothetical protein